MSTARKMYSSQRPKGGAQLQLSQRQHVFFALSNSHVWPTTTSRYHNANNTRRLVHISQYCHVMTCPDLPSHISTLKPVCCQTIQFIFTHDAIST